MFKKQRHAHVQKTVFWAYFKRGSTGLIFEIWGSYRIENDWNFSGFLLAEFRGFLGIWAN